ncbi:FMN-binding protein [Catellatospora citrea]|uniref:FMN-binding protein n=1 Tax=Catellatospora citrea TaxID=53366 RepID=UPI0033E56F22
MRRFILWLCGTAVATVLLIGAKGGLTAGGGPRLLADAPIDSIPAGDTSGQGTQDGTAPDPSATAPVPTLSAAPGATPTATPKPATGTPKPSVAPKPGATTPRPGPTTAAPPAARTINGTAVPAKDFGNVQVQIVVTGRHIDDIKVLQMSNRPRNSATVLRQEALAAQSANIANVSGATYTSNAYRQSLQAAINKI